MLSKANVSDFQQRLLAWFEIHQRMFPWRETRNPFQVLISEKLLQQTVARSTVISAYNTILVNYPTPETLADAELTDLQAIIRPLGFLYRAQELRSMALELVSRHGGEVPPSFEALVNLTGVGDYAARAVLCFAFGQPVAIVDTNVARLLFRLYGIDSPLPANPARKKKLQKLAADLTPPIRTKEYNYAVLDLCALVCTARGPKCHECPVREFCVYGSKSDLIG